jgi:hypothetical protein
MNVTSQWRTVRELTRENTKFCEEILEKWNLEYVVFQDKHHVLHENFEYVRIARTKKSEKIFESHKCLFLIKWKTSRNNSS